MRSIVMAVMASLLVSETAAVKSGSANLLIQQAMSQVEQGSAAFQHLESASKALDATAAARSQTFSVPIDEKIALSLPVSPNYSLDTVNSVTLKSFRKIVGYDTFESIR